MRKISIGLALGATLVLAAAGSATDPAAALPVPSADAPPSAFELLRQVRETYAGLASYRDHGEIEATGEPPRRFETVARADGRFRFVLETGEGIGARREVLWGTAQRADHYDSGRGAVRTSASWLSELVTLLGEGSLDVLLVPSLLAGGPEALPDPAAAAVEGPVPCGEASCWVLRLTPFGGGVESRLWIDRAAHLVRTLEVRPGADRAAPGLAVRRPAWVRVTHRVDAAGGAVAEADLAFTPPAGALHVKGWDEAPLGAVAGLPSGEVSFGEVIDVQLFSLAVRALDDSGDPIRGLGPEDFRARLDGVEIPVAAADWISSAGPGAGGDGDEAPAGPAGDAGSPAGAAAPAVPRPPASEPGIWPPEPPLPDEGQLVVVFVQSDINAPSRTRGHLATLPYARDLLDTLRPVDHVAVVSFDSHLKLWQDFTRDRAAVFAAIGRAIRFGGVPPDLERPRARREGPTLARSFDAGAAQAAASPERALEVLGQALAPLPGEKVMIYLGWGLGRYVGGVGVRMTRDYGPAVDALEAARATVFVLDVTNAAAHDLEFGLENVAAATGGTYAKTVDFPAQAAGRLARVISGHYVLSFDVERLRPGGALTVELKDRKGEVLYRPLRIQ